MYIFVLSLLYIIFFGSYYIIHYCGFSLVSVQSLSVRVYMRARDHKIMINNDREDARRTRTRVCYIGTYYNIYMYIKIKEKIINIRIVGKDGKKRV